MSTRLSGAAHVTAWGWETPGLRPRLHAPRVRRDAGYVPSLPQPSIFSPDAPWRTCPAVSSTSPHQPLSSGCASLSEKTGSHSPPLSCPFSPPLLEKVRIGRDVVGVGGAAVPESGNLTRWSTGATGRHWDCCFCPVTAHPS